MKLTRLIPGFLLIFCFLAPASSRAQFTNLWSVHLPGTYSDATPAIAADGTLYQPTFNGTLLAVTPAGQTNWQFKTGLEIESSPAIGSDGTIYFGSRDHKFYALTPEGRLKWTFQTGGWNDSSPAIGNDGTVYFGSWDKTFYALNPNGTLKWKFQSDGIIDSSPAIGADGTIYFGSHDTKFYALTPGGKLKWSFPTGGQIISSPAIGKNGNVYFTSTDGNLYALKPDGSELWRLLTGGASPSSPVIDSRGTLYLGANQYGIAVSAGGRKLWQHDLGDWVEGAPAIADSEIYFTSRSRAIAAITADGTLSWIVGFNASIATSPTISKDGCVYFDDLGHLIAIAPTNAAPPARSPWPLFRGNAMHTGRAN
ncbi:MAG TPA: PQQ-binding-like beta-propeller repeat protein [Candidatus Sulfotelmatobacter sp.]|nr:PQQ-binding-like beta-propeller repeat protein [Candidatus Sulfotelmatobacter sp.]